MDAMQIYKALSQPPASSLRQIKDGKLKGKTDINPQWRYEAMTEQFGLVGIGWKYEVQKLWTEPGANGETLAFAQVAVFVKDPETKNWSDGIVGIGGSKLINQWTNRTESNDEGYKMAVTDAFSTSLKMLGVAADIYAGRWDGSKYAEQSESNKQNKTAPQQNKTAPEPKGPIGGPDTPEEHARINDLLSATYADGSKIFSPQECKGIGNLRMQQSAAEVILMLKQEIRERREKKIAPQVQPEQQVTSE